VRSLLNFEGQVEDSEHITSFAWMMARCGFIRLGNDVTCILSAAPGRLPDGDVGMQALTHNFVCCLEMAYMYAHLAAASTVLLHFTQDTRWQCCVTRRLHPAASIESWPGHVLITVATRPSGTYANRQRAKSNSLYCVDLPSHHGL
jgi:hypothetical protein